MSYAIFPAFQGLGWPVKKTPRFSTVVHTAANGASYRTGLMQFPLCDFELTVNYLSMADIGTLERFFYGQQGALSPFLLDVQGDDTAANVVIGVGDGATKAFDVLTPNLQWVGGVTGTPSFEVAGASASAALDATQSIAAFASAPASGAAITWSGTYGYRVAFPDNIDFSQLMVGIYQAKKLKLVGCR